MCERLEGNFFHKHFPIEMATLTVDTETHENLAQEYTKKDIK